jgi:hypothetical protein
MENDMTMFWTAHILLWASMSLNILIGSEKTHKYFGYAEAFFLGGMVMHLFLV